jgi:hypothetical protein
MGKYHEKAMSSGKTSKVHFVEGITPPRLGNPSLFSHRDCQQQQQQ